MHGLVTDAQTGQPLRAAVYVSGSPYPAYTDPTVGDVHRMVVDGSYDVTVWANGYEPATVSAIQVASGSSTPFPVALQRGGNQHAFFVQSVNQPDPTNSYNNQTIPSDALGAPDGRACSLGRYGEIQSQGFLSPDDREWVPVTFIQEGERYPARLRIRGDLFGQVAIARWREVHVVRLLDLQQPFPGMGVQVVDRNIAQ